MECSLLVPRDVPLFLVTADTSVYSARLYWCELSKLSITLGINYVVCAHELMCVNYCVRIDVWISCKKNVYVYSKTGRMHQAVFYNIPFMLCSYLIDMTICDDNHWRWMKRA